jgi:hypothetical protein
VQLANQFSQPANTDLSGDQMLACTRALEMLNKFEPEFTQTLRSGENLGKLHAKISLRVSCNVSHKVGLEFRGANLAVGLRIHVSGRLEEKFVRMDLATAGWQIQ